MLRSVEDAIEVLTEGKALYYSIEGNGVNKKFEPEAEPTNEAAVDAFIKDWGRLLPGTYKVTHREKKAARQNAEFFRLTKMPDGAAVSGFGSSENSAIMGLQMQVFELQKQSELKDLKAEHEKQLEKLKTADDGSGVEKFIAAIGEVNKLLSNPHLAPIRAAVSGAAPAPAAAGPKHAAAAAPRIPAGDVQQEIANVSSELLENIHSTLDGDTEATLETVRLLARLAAEKPEEFKSYLPMLKASL